jgi:hypothetical protein
MEPRAFSARPAFCWKLSTLLFLLSPPLACSGEISGTNRTSTGEPHQSGGRAGAGLGGAGGSSTGGTGTGGSGVGRDGGAGGTAGNAGGSGGIPGGAGDAGAAGAGGGVTGGAGGGAMGGSGGSGSGDPPLGTGWVEYVPMKSIHLDDNVDLQTFPWTEQKSVCSPACADYRYDATTDTETFRILDNRSNRSEIRLHNEYSTGSRQFQGYVKFDRPLDDESLFQIWGSSSGATQLMVRGYAASGGSIRAPGGPVMATNVYGVEHRVNVIHRQGNDIRVYIDGTLKYSFADNESVTNYQKYGCYGTLNTGAATVAWRAARFYRDGAPP